MHAGHFLLAPNQVTQTAVALQAVFAEGQPVTDYPECVPASFVQNIAGHAADAQGAAFDVFQIFMVEQEVFSTEMASVDTNTFSNLRQHRIGGDGPNL